MNRALEAWPCARERCGWQGVAASGSSIDMEACFSQLTLDVIGKSVFSYDFGALTTSSPVIQVLFCPLPLGTWHLILCIVTRYWAM